MQTPCPRLSQPQKANAVCRTGLCSNPARPARYNNEIHAPMRSLINARRLVAPYRAQATIPRDEASEDVAQRPPFRGRQARHTGFTNIVKKLAR